MKKLIKIIYKKYNKNKMNKIYFNQIMILKQKLIKNLHIQILNQIGKDLL